MTDNTMSDVCKIHGATLEKMTLYNQRGEDVGKTEPCCRMCERAKFEQFVKFPSRLHGRNNFWQGDKNVCTRKD